MLFVTRIVLYATGIMLQSNIRLELFQFSVFGKISLNLISLLGCFALDILALDLAVDIPVDIATVFMHKS